MSTAVQCIIYRSKREREMYLFVSAREGTDRVPAPLLEKLGHLSEVMTFELEPERKLARAKAPEVLAALKQQGYYLQLPPDMHVTRYTLGE